MSRSILLVDPDIQHRARILRDLGGNGVRIVGEAASSDEAMRLAAFTGPDVVVVADGPGLGGGVRLADRLAAEHGVPSVLLALAGGTATTAPAAGGGVMGVLNEPLNPATLHAMLELAACRFQELLALRREVETLRKALEARKVIERAKGLLMETDGISEQEAFSRLRRTSMDTQRSMVEIARAIILSAGVSARTSQVGDVLRS
ncbi:MAG TPA: ANTAR domain-containing protein [Candidatus Methylomirabilis sp.]|nr:ANTAR domain-containing protein [Candidatus Methylomirabilis sp.]